MIIKQFSIRIHCTSSYYITDGRDVTFDNEMAEVTQITMYQHTHTHTHTHTHGGYSTTHWEVWRIQMLWPLSADPAAQH